MTLGIQSVEHAFSQSGRHAFGDDVDELLRQLSDAADK